MTFEACMERLEEIVRRLSLPGVTLDESLKLYEEGTRIAEQALELLEEGEGKMVLLQKRMENLFAKGADHE